MEVFYIALVSPKAMIQNCHLPRDVQTQILEFLLDYLNHQIHNLMQDIHSAQKKDFKSTMQILGGLSNSKVLNLES